ncbi:hypothetical protein IGI49_003033 [Enterococcus sp. AZ071]
MRICTVFKFLLFKYGLVSGRETQQASPNKPKTENGGMKAMIQKLGTKLQVQIEQAGEDKQKKVNFSNVIDNPPEEDVVKLGEIMAELSQQGSSLDSVIMTVQSRITKEVE